MRGVMSRIWRRCPSVAVPVVWMLCGLWLVCPAPADAATYYVRVDGGSPERCTGLVDAADPGSGSNQPCAWDHPFRALPPGGTPRIAGGDTLIIAAGSYMMGYGAPGADTCSSDYPWDCYVPPVPSGPDTSHPTKILGAGWNTGCSSPPELWGTERSAQVINLLGSSNVQVACLAVTDHSSCVESHSGTLACNRDTFPYGPWAVLGISAADSHSVYLKNLNIHGLGVGIRAGRLTDWTVEDVRIAGNGWAGWDGDIGFDESSNSGQMVFRRFRVEWNGCGETYPGGQPAGCWAQTAGGYGDGFGTAATSGNWLFEDSAFLHNTSDGLDLLYARLGSTITIRRTIAEGNAGNQIKTNGPAVIENSVLVGNCSYFEGKLFTSALGVDACRAMGNTVSLTLRAGDLVTVTNNTIVGEGDVLVLADCDIERSTCVGTESVRMRNNLFVGATEFLSPTDRAGLTYQETFPHGNTVFDVDYSLVTNVKDDVCPGTHHVCGGSPGLVNASLLAFDGRLLSSSPAINAGTSTGAPLVDFAGLPRDATPDLGAYEFAVAGPGTAPTVTAHPSSRAVTAGAAAAFSAAASGSPTPTVLWQVSTNNGSTWSDISAATSTTYSLTAAVTDNGRTYRAVFTNSEGSANSYSATLTVYGPATANPASLRCGAVKSGAGTALTSQTAAQTVTITFGGASSSWTATTTQTWLNISGGSGVAAGTFTVAIQNPSDVIGSSTTLTGAITVTAPTAPNSPLLIPVTLTVDQTGGLARQPPIGLVDSPLQNATGQVGAIGVTGWVVDDVGVKSVTIYRNCLAFEPAINCAVVNGVNLVYVGDATIVAGARSDIEAAYPTYPQANRAAWGYLLLTNMLPHVPNRLMFGGQGTLTLHVLAEDMEGHKRWLGRDFMTAPSVTDETPTTFTMANDTIAKPFGAIDTPTQGQTVSGSFWNFGWTLTPDSDATADAGDILMPLNGSTQWVYIDGVAVAPLGAYNLCRGTVGSPVPEGLYCDDDVASIFGNPTPQPTFTPRSANATKHRNLDAGRGPIAAYWLDTTTLSNGIHTIVWGVTDSAGRGEGIGSRYFTVLNGAGDAAAQRGSPPVAAETALREAPAQARGDASAIGTLAPAGARVWGRTGFTPSELYAEITADEAGVRHVQIPELGRLELWLGAVERGYLVANGTLRDLPTGSHLIVESGVFSWSPGPGYLGTYPLAFVRGGEQILVDVVIRPAAPLAPDDVAVRMNIDVPRAGQTVSGPITVSGWALDPRAWTGNGTDAVHVWAQRIDTPAAAPQFLGAAALGGSRLDVGKEYGAAFGTAGFSLTTDALAPGQYDITVFAWNRRTARWEDARTVRVTVR